MSLHPLKNDQQEKLQRLLYRIGELHDEAVAIANAYARNPARYNEPALRDLASLLGQIRSTATVAGTTLDPASKADYQRRMGGVQADQGMLELPKRGARK